MHGAGAVALAGERCKKNVTPKVVRGKPATIAIDLRGISYLRATHEIPSIVDSVHERKALAPNPGDCAADPVAKIERLGREGGRRLLLGNNGIHGDDGAAIIDKPAIQVRMSRALIGTD